VRRIADACPLLLARDLAIELACHALKVGDHPLDLGNPPALLIDLKLLQTN